jgi:hypothetical protein
VAFVRERGTARGYIDEDTGIRISRRQYDRLRELAGKRTHLDLETLASRRRKSRAYYDVLNARHREITNEALSKLDTTKLNLIEEQKALNDLAKSIKKSELARSQEFKQLHRDLKKLSKKRPDQRTKEDTTRLVDILEQLGRRDNIPKEVQPGESDYYRKGLMRRAKSGMYVVKGSSRKSANKREAATSRTSTQGRKSKGVQRTPATKR